MFLLSSVYCKPCEHQFLLLVKQPYMFKFHGSLIFLVLILIPILVSSECTCESKDQDQNKTHEALKYKLVGLASILVAGALGVSLPFLANNIISCLHPDKNVYFMVKAFAAGVILATGFIHILPNAFETLTSSCLEDKPWGSFPFAGFVAMMSAIGTLMMEAFATGYHKRSELSKPQPVNGDEEESGGTVLGGHVHGSGLATSSDLVRNRVISQVLELGIVVHSVIIGVSLGASQSLKTIKPLVVALSFHQFFEGMGLGGCIFQAKFKKRAIVVMVLFFSVTTPTGIAVGIGITRVYNDKSPTALIVEGVLNSASAGILIYMALVNLLANDFMSSRLQTQARLQLGASFALLLGASCMSLLAKWGGS